MKNVVKHDYYINNADVNIKGESMGYDWNTICNWIRDAELYGQDGDGSTTVYRDEFKDKNEDLNKIINAILDEAGLEEIKVID